MANVLSVRSPYHDQELADDVVIDGPQEDLFAPRLVILVHGYQNDITKAGGSFGRFRAALRGALALRSETALGAFWEFHWPGDDERYPLSVLGYPTRVHLADGAGDRLGEFLADLDPRQEVHLVAHSLGCRVALAAARRVRRTNAYAGACLGHVLLFAAAVPMGQCVDEQGRPFRPPMPVRGEQVYYSRSDRVLRHVFAVGQSAAGERGAVAVGREGGPPGRWLTTTNTGLGHSDYWGSYEVAAHAGPLLGARLAPPVSALAVPEASLASVEPATRWTRERRVTTRAGIR